MLSALLNLEGAGGRRIGESLVLSFWTRLFAFDKAGAVNSQRCMHGANN
jgi:hypothetical protein